MNNYLCINFNRYDTERSKHNTIQADGPQEALYKFLFEQLAADATHDEIQREYQYLLESYIQVSDTFSCVPGEENDYLIYKI